MSIITVATILISYSALFCTMLIARVDYREIREKNNWEVR